MIFSLAGVPPLGVFFVIQHEVVGYNITLCTTTFFTMVYIQYVFLFHTTCYI